MRANLSQSKQRAQCDDKIHKALPSHYAVLLPWVLILLSWLLLVSAFVTQHNSLFDHDYLLSTSRLPWIIALVIFLMCWQVMTMAMMLPSSLSRLLILYDVHKSRWYGQAAFIMSYALVWSGFACLAFSMDTLLHQLIQHWWWLYVHSQLIGTLTLALAGVWQWSPLKRHCVQHCIALTHTQTKASLQEATSSHWRQGSHYGLRCLGSSWALMLVMFGIGMKSLFIMALLTTIMFLEREGFKSERLRYIIGSAFLLLAVLWYFVPFSTYL